MSSDGSGVGQAGPSGARAQAAHWAYLLGTRDSWDTATQNRGLSCDAVRELVEGVGGSPMTPLPGGPVWEQIRVLEVGDQFERWVCPLWTESGRSELDIVVWVEPIGRGLLNSYIEQVRMRAGTVLLEVDDSHRQRDPNWRRQPHVPGVPSGETRIRRSAYVGSSVGILIDQLVRGFHRGLGDDLEPHLDGLNVGQRAIFVGHSSFTYIYGGGLGSLYRGHLAYLVRELPAAARTVGADQIARVIEQANAVFPDGVLSDPDAMEDYVFDVLDEIQPNPLDAVDRSFSAVEDAGQDMYTCMTNYVDDHPEQFFLG